MAINADRTIDYLRQKLKQANADSVRLSDYTARVINDHDKSTRMLNNKIERLETNEKVLEAQLELAVNEKHKSEGKLLEVEVQRDDFQCELNKLKLRHEKQETKLTILRQEMESTNEQRKEIFAKFKLMKNQETVHDAVVGALKKQFEEKICDFLNDDASNAVAVPVNISFDMVSSRCRPAACNRNNPFSGSTSKRMNDDDKSGVKSNSTENISDHNRCRTVESVMQGKVVLQRLSIRKISGTIIQRSTSTSTSTTSRVTRTETIETHKRVEVKQPPTMITERLTSGAIVERRSQRSLSVAANIGTMEILLIEIKRFKY